jgi:hypothetical protein
MPAENDPITYLAEIELAFVSSPIIAEYQVIHSWVNTDDGYVRVRATLINGDLLEVSEYFVLQKGHFVTVDYHYQLMDGNKKILRRRWDNTPHYPNLDNFPYHVHISDEANVVPGQPINLVTFLKLFEDGILS